MPAVAGLGAFGVFGLMVAMPSAAAEETAASSVEPAGAVRLAPVSITATRSETDPFSYPGMVTVIDRDRVRDFNAATPDELFELVPNVEFTGGPRRTGEVPSIRGFDGENVVILIDGVRQNFNSRHDGRFFLEPSLIGSVEVLRGPASALYGSGGLGGVIEIRTIDADDVLTPDETVGVTTSLGGYSVNDEWVATATAYGRPIPGVELLGSVTRRESGPIDLGNDTTLDSAEDRILSGLVKGTIALGDHHRLEASFSRFSNDAKEPNNGQGLGDGGLVDKEIASDSVRLAYSVNDPTNAWVDLDAVAYYTSFKADEQRLDGQGAGPTGELLTRDVDTLGVRVDNRSRFGVAETARVTLTYGVEAYRDEQTSESASGDRDGVPNATATFLGVFGQAEVVLDDLAGLPGTLTVLPGLRFDRYEVSGDAGIDDATESRPSPRIGVSYQPQPWLVAFANYAHAFRAPSFNEMFLSGTHFEIPALGITNRFVANPDLEPQTTRTVEFGAGVDFDGVLVERDSLTLKGSHFRTWGDDFIDRRVEQPTPFVDCTPFIPGNCDGTTISYNVPSARLWGTEIEGRYENDRVRIELAFSTIDGENTDTEEKLGVLTPDTVSVDVGVKVPEVDALVGWRATVAGRFDKVNEPADTRDAYDVHDLYVVYQPSAGVLDGLRVDLGIDNLFDEDYSRVFTDASEAGRSFKALVSYSVAW